VSQLRLIGIDIRLEKAAAALEATRSHNQRAGFAAGDARHLPFKSAVFDSTYCVAVLQHVRDVAGAVEEFARVTAPGGRVLVVEPDNAGRSFYSSVPGGARAFALAGRFFSALLGRSHRGDASVGPKLPGMLAGHGVEPIDVRLFPVTQTQLGTPSEEFWRERRSCIEHLVNRSRRERVQAIGRDYLAALDAYRAEAADAGPAFVEIQNTILFATVGQRSA
jgi:SAM-dependent methyltransferase